jgi:hypothetical protein
MKIVVHKIDGDACVSIYDKESNLIHFEEFSGKSNNAYERTIPVEFVDYGSSKALYYGEFDYTISIE